MITVNLKGGLGNQMFQYAAARSLSLQFRTPLVLNTEYFSNIPKGDTPRVYQLDTFHIVSNVQLANTIPPFKKLLQKIILKFTSEKVRFSFAKFFLQCGLSAHLNGYFQGEQYFAKTRETILNDFTLAKPLGDSGKTMTELLASSASVAINVRRGDYLRADYAKFYGVLDMRYYSEAIMRIKEKVSNPLFCIFSDDPEWAKESFHLEGAVFVGTDAFQDYEQFYLMTQCKHNIIANSSFAWWGAWLGTNPDKIVIAPKQWTARKTADELEVLPKEWIQI